MKTYLIRGRDPLDMEGYPDVVGVVGSKKLAKATVEMLNAREEERCKAAWGEKWFSFSWTFEVEERTLATTAQEILEKHYNIEQ